MMVYDNEDGKNYGPWFISELREIKSAASPYRIKIKKKDKYNIEFKIELKAQIEVFEGFNFLGIIKKGALKRTKDYEGALNQAIFEKMNQIHPFFESLIALYLE